MTVITSLPPPSRSGSRSVRLYLAIFAAIIVCSRWVDRWTPTESNGAKSHAKAALFSQPEHVRYFPHGEKGYLPADYCIDNAQTEQCCNENHCAAIVNRSTLYSECCGRVHNTDETTITRKGRQRSKLLPLLITSAPRSGTRFIQQLFTKVGLDGLTNDNHSPQNRGTVSWKHVFDDQHYIAERAPTHLYQSKFRVIWHLVRDPLDALTSLAFTEPLLEDSIVSQQYVNYIAKHISLTNSTSLRQFFGIAPDEWEGRNRTATAWTDGLQKFRIYRGMEIYLHWHGFINHLNVPVFRLEDLSVRKNVTVLDQVFHSVSMTPPQHRLVLAFLEARENLHRRRLSQERRRLQGWDENNGLPMKLALHKNERDHRDALRWSEVCGVNKRKARELLKMSQSFGYYPDLDVETLCPR